MSANRKTRFVAIKGGYYPSTLAGCQMAKDDATMRPGDPRIAWTRFEAGEEIVPPYREIIRSLKINRLVEEVS